MNIYVFDDSSFSYFLSLFRFRTMSIVYGPNKSELGLDFRNDLVDVSFEG